MDRRSQPYPRNLPSDELLCFPVLDTGSDEERQAAQDELLQRGYPRWLIRSLRAVAGVGLWYQCFAWEWGSLGAFDVLLGYGVIFLAASPFVFVLSPMATGLLFGAGVLSFATAIVGFRWRRSGRG